MLRVDGGPLVEDFAGIWVQTGEAARNVFLVAGDDGVLGHVFDLVGLGVWVRDVFVLAVLIDPVAAAGQGRGAVGVEEVE